MAPPPYRRRVRVAFALLAGSLGACLQLPQDTGPADDPDRPTWLLREVERLRGLERDARWEVALESAATLDRVFADVLAREYPEPVLRGLEETYRAFGWLEEEGSLAVALSAALAAEGYAVYDPVGGRLHVLRELLEAGRADGAIAFHGNQALEHERFDLEAGRVGATERGRDAWLAWLGLVKGSAYNLLYELPFERDFTDSLIALRARLPGAPTPARRPAAEDLLRAAADEARARWLLARDRDLRDLLLFPHTHGRAFVRALRRRYGWAMVDRALQDPPRSTEQILHPEKYHLHRDDPVAITLASDLDPPGTSRFVHEGTLGEYALGVWLRAASDDAADLAAGWGGDRYRLVVDADGGRWVAWHVAWDTADAADAFARVAPDVPRLRLGASVHVRVERASPTDVLVLFGPREEPLAGAAERMRAGDRVVLPEAHAVDEFVWTDVLLLPARAVLDVTDGDHTTDVDLLGGLLLSTEFTRFGGRVELLKGGLLSYENGDERFRIALLFGLLSYHVRHRGETGFASLFPLLESGWRGDGAATGFALDLVGFGRAPGHSRWSAGLVGRAVTHAVTIDADGALVEGDETGEDLSFLFGLVTTGHREGRGRGGAQVRLGSTTLVGSLLFASVDRRILAFGAGIDVAFEEWSLGTPLLVQRSYRQARTGARDGAAERDFRLLGGLLYANWSRGPHAGVTTPLVGWRHDATGRYVTWLFGLLPLRVGEGEPRPVPLERPRGF